MNFITGFIVGFFDVDDEVDPDDVTEDEIKTLVNESHEDGQILASEAEMIQNILSFDEKDAKDIMVHRGDIVAISSEMTLHETILFVIDNTFSRYPVYKEDLDDIVGIIHIKDILELISKNYDQQLKLCEIKGLLRPVETVPETHGINTLFTTMQREKSHMIIIVDEYGQTSGLVAMEDILEEIVGNIQDEHDNEKESVSKVNEKVYMMEGRTSIEDVCKTLDIEIDEDDVETLNGLLMKKIGRVPKMHEEFSINLYGYSFHILDVAGNVIQGVRVIKLNEDFIKSEEI